MPKKPRPKIEITKHPDFRVAHVTGVFGAVKADEGFIKFYCDILEPKMKNGGKPGQMDVVKITRELQFEVRMTSTQFMSIANWMMQHINKLKKKGIIKETKKTPKEAEAYRV